MYDDVRPVSDEVTPVPAEEVDRLESDLGHRLPDGYRELVTRFGAGLYDHLVDVWVPERVLGEGRTYRETFADYWFWDPHPVLTQESAARALTVGDSADGDVLVVLPEDPDTVFVLPRNSEAVVEATGLHATLELMTTSGRPWARRVLPLPIFEPHVKWFSTVWHRPDVPHDDLVTAVDAAGLHDLSGRRDGVHEWVFPAFRGRLVVLEPHQTTVQLLRHPGPGEAELARLLAVLPDLGSAHSW